MTNSSDREALAGELRAYLRSKGSPLADQVDHLVDSGRRWNVDPRLLVAISGGESSFGRRNFQPYNAWGWMSGDSYGSWAASIDAVAKGLRTYYLDKGLTSLVAIQRKYAPLGAGNDPTNLNSNWLRNISRYYSELGGDPADVRV